MAVVTDDFNRANTSSFAGVATELSGDWEVVSNKLQCNTDLGATGYYLRYDTAVGSDDMYSQAVVSSTQANGTSNTGVLCRGQTGATVTSYQFVTRHAGDVVSFWRVAAGTETKLRLACNATAGTQDIPVVFASGATIREEVVGSLIRGLIDGVLVGVARDISGSAIPSGQRGGLNGYNNVGSDFVELDDFEAGPLDDKVAPFVAGVGEQSSGTATTSTAFTTPASSVPANIAAGDLLVAHVTSRDDAQTVTAPGSEGWSAPIENPSQTGLEDYVFGKIWGLGGQTDDTTPTFSIGAGTSGWAVTFVIWRNPLHATNPWTSVTDAIVASASQTTTVAGATVTAPSVTDTAPSRTIVRLFSSADDNSLGLTTASLSNSEGALVYGGLDFDTIAGLDMAQAMSTRENVTTAGAIGTATVTEHINGTDVNNGITLVLAIPSGGTDGTASPGVIAVGVSFPQAEPSAGASAAPGAVAVAASLPAASATGAGTAEPAALAVPVSMPATAAAGGGTATPDAIVVATSLPTPVIEAGGATVEPAAIATAVTILAATASAGATVSPAVLVLATLLPLAAVSGGGGALVDITIAIGPTRIGSAVIAATRSRAQADVAATRIIERVTVGATRLSGDIGPTRTNRGA